MTDKYVKSGLNTSHGTYTSVQIASALGQTEIIVNLNILAALFGFTVTNTGVITELGVASKPDFNKISAATRHALALEIAALAVAVEAMPTA